MKLTPEQKIIEAAKLDGNKAVVQMLEQNNHPNQWPEVKAWLVQHKKLYDEQFDAIIPLIQKQPKEIQWLTFANLAQIVSADTPAYLGSPSQYLDALLTAHGFEV